MVRFLFKCLWFLVSFTGRALLLLLSAGAEAGQETARRRPQNQYQRRYSWQERSGYSWTNRHD